MVDRRGFLTLLAALFTVNIPLSAPKRYALNRCYVAGLQYHPGIGLKLKNGEKIKTVRDPENPYDANAVALYSKGVKLGYIPKKENTTLAMLMDQDAALHARVEHFDEEAKSWERVEIVVEKVG